MKRSFSFPDSLQNQISSQFPKMKVPKYITEAILWMSDNFQARDSITPWGEPQRQQAYLVYFHALNVVRMIAVLQSLKEVVPEFYSATVLDFGSGLGSSELAWNEVFEKTQWIFLEQDKEARKFHQHLLSRPITDSEWISSESKINKNPETVIASYSLNELNTVPHFFMDADNLILLEPSTKTHARRLMQLRQPLINAGFQILAPCIHQSDCPLLIHSKKDWCHDRIHLKSPDWFQKLENQLPMTNRTLTFSYLIASKKYQTQIPKESVRIIGDTIREKGKTRQMICRGEEREFLSWLRKYGSTPEIPHGSLYHPPGELEKKGDELRTVLG